VQAYTDGGTTLARTITSGIAGPDAIAVDPSNTLYVANVSANTITEYASGSTTPTATITTGISQPTALAFDTAGTLYVANYGNNSVTEYATGTTVPSTTIPSTSGISGPFGLVVSNPVPAGTPYLFVANLGANDITSYTVGGTALQTTFTGTDFVDATPPFTTPRIPVAVDSTGKLYAVNYGANSVTTYLASAGAAPGTTITSNMDEPISAALDNSNNLYVANAIGGALSPNGIITAYAGGGQVNTRSLRNAAGVNGPTAVFPLGP
jgi:serine/threonine-protein kinase